MSIRLQAIRGFNDVLPPAVTQWQHLEAKLRACVDSYAYQEIKLPMLESSSLFKRCIGEVTDIVEKEMYTFNDLNGDSLSLRPEGTAGCVRAMIEHGMLRQVQKLWYFGPMFRHEKPQKGRYRQFYQFGVEIFGVDQVAADLELLLMTHDIWRSLGLAQEIHLQLNCLGQMAERLRYRDALLAFFEAHRHQLSEEESQRLIRNPLRLLDSKAAHIQALLSDAPKLIDFISQESRHRFDSLCQALSDAGIAYQLNPYLVRGLDYYNELVFEWVSDHLGSQATVCAGGRYNILVEQLGGPKTPAIGFALGVERLLLLLENRLSTDNPIDVYILSQEPQPLLKTQVLARLIRQELGLKVEVNLSTSSLKSQFKRADKSGAMYALILGADELQKDVVTLKLLRQHLALEQQLTLPHHELLAFLKKHRGESNV